MAFGVRSLVRSCLIENKLHKRLLVVSSCSVHKLSKHGDRVKSTVASATIVDNRVQTEKPDILSADELDLTFSDYEAAFKSKTNYELVRALMVFGLCSKKPLVQNSDKLMKLGLSVLGEYLFSRLMKASFYGQFVAGEDQHAIQPKIQHLRSFGVKSVLDYSVEEDISPEKAVIMEMESTQSQADGEPVMKRFTPQEKFGDRRQNASARTYFYINEAQCEKNMETFIDCIDAVSDATHGTGFAAIKMTALGRPQLLMQLSEVIYRTRKYSEKITGKSGAVLLQDVSRNVFEKRFKEENILTDNNNVRQWLQSMTYDRKGLIHLFSWSGLIDANILLQDLFKVPNLDSGKLEPIISALTKREEEMFKNMMRRLNTIFTYAKERDVRVMVDAEQTYFQPAISRLTMELMKKYNQEKAIVFNTYQCYLKDTMNNLQLDLEQCHRQGFYFGAKLVRGAYMEQERARAEELCYEDPVNPSYDVTSQMYHDCLDNCMKEIKKHKENGDPQRVAVMVASHNEDTIRYTVKKMIDYSIHPLDRVICFGQLLGMCDHISMPLGQCGFSVYKYVPYGPVNKVLPYLSRRTAENSAVFVKLKKEKRLMWKELFRRLRSGKLLYSPTGNYKPIGAVEKN